MFINIIHGIISAIVVGNIVSAYRADNRPVLGINLFVGGLLVLTAYRMYIG